MVPARAKTYLQLLGAHAFDEVERQRASHGPPGDDSKPGRPNGGQPENNESIDCHQLAARMMVSLPVSIAAATATASSGRSRARVMTS